MWHNVIGAVQTCHIAPCLRGPIQTAKLPKLIIPAKLKI